MEIYGDIYILTSKCMFNSQYIESISPAERKLYISILKQENKLAENGDQSDNRNALNAIGVNVEDLL